MPKCPNCGKEIDRLGQSSPEIVYYECWRDERYGGLEYEHSHKIENTQVGDIAFFCPECSADLFTTEEEAIAFLGGEAQR